MSNKQYKSRSRNYALFQTMGMAAFAQQIENLSVEIGGKGFSEVKRCASETSQSIRKLIEALRNWKPNEEEK